MTSDQTIPDAGGGDQPWRETLAETIRDAPAAAATRETSIDGDPSPFEAGRLVPVPPGLDLAARYDDEGFLGRGGGGEVHAVGDRLLERSVAVKLVYQAHAEDPIRLHRFLTEARITAGLEHPNILPVYDLGRAADGRWWFTMRRAVGCTLADAIRDHDARFARLEDRVQVLLRICDAVAYAHGRGVVHRDLKPANILLGDFGEVIVADWGTARRLDDAPTVGRLVGTPLYMAPEQARGENADARSDVYALGLILAELVLHHLPIPMEAGQEAFWEDKRRGRVDLPAREGLEGALLDIAATAVAPHPSDRHADAGALRLALQNFLRHQESLALAQRAEGDLQILQVNGDHRGFARVAEQFRQARDLWEGNRQAVTGLLRAQAAQARFALDHGDVDLALAVLDEGAAEHQDLRTEAMTAQRRRAESQHRARSLRRGLAVLATLLIVAVGALAWEYASRAGAWITVFDRDLRVAPVDLSGLSLLGRMSEEIPIEELHHDPGQGVLVPATHWLWLGVRERGDVRLEIEASWPEQVDGLEVVLHARREIPPVWWNVPQGVSCQFAGSQGDHNYISENPVGGEPDPSNSRRHRFQAQRSHRFTIEIASETMTISGNGRVLVTQPRILTIGDAANHGIAIRCWAATHIQRITVKRLRPPAFASPTLVGDALVARGAVREGIDHYLALVEDFRGQPLAEEALVHACLAAARLDDGLAEQQALLERLRHLDPDPRRLQVCEEAFILATWRGGRYADALDRLDQLQRNAPSTRIILALAEKRPPWLEPAVGRRLAHALAAIPDRPRMDLSGLGLTDITFLRGVRVSQMLLAGNAIHDLEPLRGADLTYLDLAGNQVQDLSPLTGLSLRVLTLDGNPVRDLSPLAGMSLKEVMVSRTEVVDLGPLRGAPLTRLDVSDTAVADLGPVRGAPLVRVDIARSAVRDLDPIAQARLIVLQAFSCTGIDLGPLARCAKLKELNVGRCGIRDLGPLTGLKLDRLTISDNPELADLGPLAGARLTSLTCSRTAVRDLEPLRSQTTLANLFAASTAVEDLAPLAGLSLVEVDLSGTPTRDLSVLAGMPLQRLFAHPTAARDLGFLQGLPGLVSLDLYASDLSVAEGVAMEDALERAGQVLQAAQLRTVRAWVGDDLDLLRRQARLINGRQRLVMPVRLTLAEHRTLAARLGAGLMEVRDQADDAALCRVMGYGHAVWLDLARDGRGLLRWASGRPLDYTRPVGVQMATVVRADEQFLALDVGGGGMLWYPIHDLDHREPAIYEWPEDPASP